MTFQQGWAIKDLARLLGTTSRQVHAWHVRSLTTGFPKPIYWSGTPEFPGDKKGSPRFDMDAVVEWFSGYDPNANRGAHWKKKREQKRG